MTKINPFYFVFGICAVLLLLVAGVRVALYLSERKFR